MKIKRVMIMKSLRKKVEMVMKTKLMKMTTVTLRLGNVWDGPQV